MGQIGVWIYRLMEMVDGEKGLRLVPYRYAERIKLFCLQFIV